MKILKGLATALLWILVLLSFTANALLLRLLVDARAQAAEAIKLSQQAVTDLQAGAIRVPLAIQKDVTVDVVLPAGLSIPTDAGAIKLSQELSVPATVHLDLTEPLQINVADTPLNASLLSAKDYLGRLYTQWQSDPLQALLAPLPK